MELTKEEFLAQQEQEEMLMDALFSNTPLSVQMDGKKEILNHIAQTAVDLYEIREQNQRDSEVDQVFEKIMRGE